MRTLHIQKLVIFSLLFLSIKPLLLQARPFVLVLSQDDIKDAPPSSEDDPIDWDDFGESETRPDESLDPGSWSPIFEPSIEPENVNGTYYATVGKMMSAVSDGDVRLMEEAVSEIEASAADGDPHARSVLGFLHGMGQTKARNKGKAFLYHHFAAEGGSIQSKMALAYTYLRQDVRNLN